MGRLLMVVVVVWTCACGSVSDSGDRADAAPDRSDGGGGGGGADADVTDVCSHADPFTAAEPLQGLNTGDGEHNAWLSPDERFIAFSRLPAGGDSNLYTASRDSADGAFEAVDPIDELNTGEREYRPWLTDDLKTIYFDRIATASNYDIMVATRDVLDAEFGDAAPVANVNGDGNSDYQPSVAASGMYLASSRGGEIELFHAPREGTGFGAAEPLDAISSSVSESLPIPSADGKAIYFAADGREPGGVDWDVWVAIRDNLDDDFVEAVLVDGTVNGPAADAPAWLSPDNCRLYYKTDADGDYDLWVATREP
jgi:hypothetical protein